MRSLTHGTERSGRAALRVTALLTLVIGISAVPATAGAATGGALKQLAGGAGCLIDEASPIAGCKDIRAMQNIGQIAMSPNGDQVYVPSKDRDAIVVLDRDATTGELTQKAGPAGCVTSNSTVAAEDGCVGPPAVTASSLDGVSAVAVSPDGKNVYATAPLGSRVTTFTRAASGELAFFNNTLYAGQPSTLAISPNGDSVYIGVRTNSGFIGINTRNQTSGLLSFTGCLTSNTGSYGCTSTPNIQEPARMIVTPDNNQLLVSMGDTSGCCTWALLGFGRTSASTLTAPTVATCVSGSGTLGGTCQSRSGMAWPRGIALADNGGDIYVAGYDGLFTIDRDPATNALTPRAGDCTMGEGYGFAGCTTVGPGASVSPGRDVVVSTDGTNVYNGTESSTPTIYAYDRVGGGGISTKPSPTGCINPAATLDCSVFRSGNRIESMLAAPGGRHIYAAGNNRLFGFARDRPPTCANVSANTAHNTSVAIHFSCSDPDGDAVTYEKVTDPPHGTLGGVQGNVINYNPLTGSVGADSFSYRAVAAGTPSDPATATVTVAGPIVVPPPLTLIPSTVTNKWSAFPSFTKVRGLSVKTLRAGTKIVVTCKTKKKKLQKKRCPYKSKTFTSPTAKSTLNLAKKFHGKKLPVGTKIAITITAPNSIGKVFTYTIRKRALPSLKLQCVAPGAKPGKCT